MWRDILENDDELKKYHWGIKHFLYKYLILIIFAMNKRDTPNIAEQP